MITILVAIGVAALIINLWFTFQLYQSWGSLDKDRRKLLNELSALMQDTLSKEIREWRNEMNNAFRENRKESLENFSDSQKRLMHILSERFQEITQQLKSFEAELRNFSVGLFAKIPQLSNDISQNLSRHLEQEQRLLRNQISEWDRSWTEKFTNLEKLVSLFTEQAEQKLRVIKETVDEKLQESLESRLTEAFKLVDSQLKQVQIGLGEMRTLASGVGDLKKVLSNVKSRGVLGEWQLENLLEALLTPEQFEKNVVTKSGSKDRVEFAIRLPGKDDKNANSVYLPIDAKFPQEDYQRLQEAYEVGDLTAIEDNRKKLSLAITKAAKDIAQKYISPPDTTDFALLFLPFEGLYAEVLRIPGLFDNLQREQKVIITGPTTLSAILNSLQLGFRTLAIQKRSGEVWQILKNVKAEFGKFAEVLEKARKKINEADKELENLMQTRTQQLQRKLNAVEKYAPLGTPASSLEEQLEI
jgi:DNA recombination protein RmuC